MILKMYSVLDEKVGAFDRPFFAPSDAAAIRAFGDGVSNEDPNNPWFKHPEDYSLHYVGEFDQVTGVFTPGVMRICLVTASALVAARPGVLNFNGSKIETPA